jgi:toxin HigB-1
MRLTFRTDALKALETEDDPSWSEAITTSFRRKVNFLRQAHDERDFRSMRSLRFEQLKGNRSHQYSIRLNDQFRLILEFVGSGTDKVVHVVDIEDYH